MLMQTNLPVRVAIAGATGFAGQELIRLLTRHPHVTITAATGSQSTSAPQSSVAARYGTAPWCRSIPLAGRTSYSGACRKGVGRVAPVLLKRVCG